MKQLLPMITINQIIITFTILNKNKNAFKYLTTTISIKQHHQQQQHNQNFAYNVNLKFEPQIPTAGNTTTIAINITEQKTGNVIRHFETIHDKLMHLIIISEEDLYYFEHIHPALDTYRSMFFINHSIP